MGEKGSEGKSGIEGMNDWSSEEEEGGKEKVDEVVVSGKGDIDNGGGNGDVDNGKSRNEGRMGGIRGDGNVKGRGKEGIA
uniref:hypothetical protein n=1 Tax=Staphylococcus aureus TaxID=1280 RepID=UPI0011AAC7FA